MSSWVSVDLACPRFLRLRRLRERNSERLFFRAVISDFPSVYPVHVLRRSPEWVFLFPSDGSTIREILLQYDFTRSEDVQRFDLAVLDARFEQELRGLVHERALRYPRQARAH